MGNNQDEAAIPEGTMIERMAKAAGQGEAKKMTAPENKRAESATRAAALAEAERLAAEKDAAGGA